MNTISTMQHVSRYFMLLIFFYSPPLSSVTNGDLDYIKAITKPCDGDEELEGHQNLQSVFMDTTVVSNKRSRFR